MREQQSLRHELAILRLRHPDSRSSDRIPRLVASFLSPSSFHLLLAHSSGGDVFSVLERKNEGVVPGQELGLPEDMVRLWMAELLDAVEWLHGEGWAHRDVKPQNMLIEADGHLLLTDFGSAAPFTPETTSIARKYCRALTGTPDYIAPEVLRHAEMVFEENEDDEGGFEECANSPVDENERAFGAEVDGWACGVVLYELLVGKVPFFAEEISETYERIVNWQDFLVFPPPAKLSSLAQQVIRSLLVSAEERPSFAVIKALPWFTGLDWAKLRSYPATYLPPAFHAPPSSPSFSRSQHSFNQSLDYSSFFSSPGLSILRPSPRTVDSARREEREYWEARDFRGLTTLPHADEFSHHHHYPPALDNSARPAARQPASADRSAASVYETPARPFGRHGRVTAPSTAEGGPTTSTPASSGRSRRMISEMDAWKEMQEHAWVVGMSARKQRRESGAGTGLGGPLASTLLQDASNSPRPPRSVAPVKDEGGEKLGGLEERQREMVERLEEMDRKYGGLFALAAKEGGGR
ncbi:hypothetical protein JCM10213v2_002566 [Rhodosporidiobolus nylandii]